jgi:hypothetical protein
MDIMAATEFLSLNLDGKTGIGWLGYIIIGGIAGWLAGKIVKGRGQGILIHRDRCSRGLWCWPDPESDWRGREQRWLLVYVLRRVGRGRRIAVASRDVPQVEGLAGG